MDESVDTAMHLWSWLIEFIIRWVHNSAFRNPILMLSLALSIPCRDLRTSRQVQTFEFRIALLILIGEDKIVSNLWYWNLNEMFLLSISLSYSWIWVFSLWVDFYSIIINMVRYKGAQPQTADLTSSKELTRDDQDSKFDLTICAVSKKNLNCLPKEDPEINLSLVWRRK